MLTSPEGIRRDPGFAHRHREMPRVVTARLEFEEFDDLAGDASDVAGRIERDGMIALEYGGMYAAD